MYILKLIGLFIAQVVKSDDQHFHTGLCTGMSWDPFTYSTDLHEVPAHCLSSIANNRHELVKRNVWFLFLSWFTKLNFKSYSLPQDVKLLNLGAF